MVNKMMHRRSSSRTWMIPAGIVGGIILAGGITLLVSPELRQKAMSMFDREGVRGAGSDASSLRRKARHERQEAQAKFEKNPTASDELRREVNILESDMDRSFDL